MVAVPRVAEQCSWKGWGVEPPALFWGPPHAQGVVLVPACVLPVQPRSNLVHGPGNNLDELGGRTRGSGGSGLELVQKLGSRVSQMRHGRQQVPIVCVFGGSNLGGHKQRSWVKRGAQLCGLLRHTRTQIYVLAEKRMT